MKDRYNCSFDQTVEELVAEWHELKSDKLDVSQAIMNQCDLRGALDSGKITPKDLGYETVPEALRKIDELVSEARRRE